MKSIFQYILCYLLPIAAWFAIPGATGFIIGALLAVYLFVDLIRTA